MLLLRFVQILLIKPPLQESASGRFARCPLLARKPTSVQRCHMSAKGQQRTQLHQFCFRNSRSALFTSLARSC